MSKEKVLFKVLGLVFMAELWMTAGHIFLKKSANTIDPDAPWDLKWLIHLFQRPFIWSGIFLILVGLLFWYHALSHGDLSVTYSLGSMQYVIALLASYFFLGEKVDRKKILGTLLIMGGIVLITLSSK